MPFVLGALLLTGCARTLWAKPGATTEDFERDKFRLHLRGGAGRRSAFRRDVPAGLPARTRLNAGASAMMPGAGVSMIAGILRAQVARRQEEALKARRGRGHLGRRRGLRLRRVGRRLTGAWEGNGPEVSVIGPPGE